MKALSIRIATYNLQKCVGLDLRRNPHRALEVLQATGAQVALVQEADKRLAPRPAALPRDLLTREGWEAPIFGGHHVSLGWHGNAILLRKGVKVAEVEGIDLPGLEPRGAIRADLDTPVGRLRLVGVHLGLVGRYRKLQAAALRRVLSDLPACPTVVAGDFNEWGDGRALESELRLPFLPSPPSYPALRPVARLDRFAITEDLSAGPVCVHLAQPARVASDHLPIWVDLSRA